MIRNISVLLPGFAIPHSIQRTDIGGRDVTEWMRWLLMKEGHTFHTSPEFEVVRQIKERMCYLALNPDKEEQQEKEATASYQLPDGSIIDIGPARFRTPELLFQPHLFGHEWPGIHEVLHNAIRKSDLDLRKVCDEIYHKIQYFVVKKQETLAMEN